MSESCSGNCESCAAGCPSGEAGQEDLRIPANPSSRIQRILGVVSGKGGVGKSFLASYLAVLFRRKGYRTAILDADMTGPSIPRAFGLHGSAMGTEAGVLPTESREGVKIMSVNLLLPSEEAPVIWRGPVIANMAQQFWTEVLWGDVDYMFVDMPPGTGDVPLTIFQSLPLDGIVIVTSPQDLVSMIVAKAVNMAREMGIPALGIVENYSYVLCENCGEKIYAFGKSKLEDVASAHGLKVLATLPLSPTVSAAVDRGDIEGLQVPWLDGAAAYLESVLPVPRKAREDRDEGTGTKGQGADGQG